MKFFVGVGGYRLDLSGCRSLKDKRQALKSILDRLGNRRGTGASEVGDHELWKTARIAVVCVTGSYGAAGDALARARRMIEATGVDVVEKSELVINPEDIQED